MGKLNFCGHLISQFYPTHKTGENFDACKNMSFSVLGWATVCRPSRNV